MKKQNLVLALVPLVFLYAAHRVEATVITYRTFLSGANENPVNASPGTGTAEVEYDDVLHTLTVGASFTGLLGTTTAAHIHCCEIPPTNAGVATQTPSFMGFPLGVTAGIMDDTAFDLTLASSYRAGFITMNGGTPAGAEAALVAGLAAGLSYFNIHTNVFPGGEIRGILTQVPEPATMGLLALGLGTLAFSRRKRKA